MDSWLEPMDFYCERISTAFWSEPINALTNLAFIIAGLHILSLAKKNQLNSKWIVALAFNTLIIGIGSFLFHTYANFLTMWGDVFPIMILICLTFFYVLKYVFQLSWGLTSFIVLLFFILGFVLKVVVPPLFNGSIMYAHAVGGLILISFFARKKHPAIFKYYGLASIVFVISLTFRTLDNDLCESFPLGTHFLWHTFNGITIWLTQKGIVEFQVSTK